MSNRNTSKFNNKYEINVVEWDQQKLQKYITLLIIGYFGVKIFYGIFNKYTKKPMKEEIVDFSVMIVMGGLLYVLTNMDKRNLLGHLGNVNWLFFLGYLIGLNVPFIYGETISNKDISQNKPIQYIFYGLFIFLLLVMVYLSIRSSGDSGNPLYYILYLIVIAIIIMGLIITRRKPNTYGATKLNKTGQDAHTELSKYFNSDSINDMMKTDEFKKAAQKSVETRDNNYVLSAASKHLDLASVQDKDNVGNLLASMNKSLLENGYINVHGTYISFSLASIGWLLSLLFMYDAEETILNRFLNLFNGLTIGMFVAGVSFYGFGYILSDQKEQQCFGDDECNREDMVYKNKEYTNIASTLSTIKWGLSFTILILIITIILFYMLRF